MHTHSLEVDGADLLCFLIHILLSFYTEGNSLGSALGLTIIDHPLQLNTHTPVAISVLSHILHNDSYNALCTEKLLFLTSLKKSVSLEEKANE